MLFNSFEFIFLFLPVTLAVYFLLGRRQLHQMAIAWLVACSLFFYAWWNPAYLGLLVGSILFNYGFGAALASRPGARGRWLLAAGVAANLGVLGYFKYANFFLDNVALLTGNTFHPEVILLPLGVSFITFQKIAYLVDAWQGKTREYNFLHFSLFVTFFPQLIAGPIVHHGDVMPQFAQRTLHAFRHENLSVGLSIFIVGLFKKVVIADSLAQFATPVFTAAATGTTLTLFEAWTGALAYAFQLYFDFSGYSDMAIGLARLFGVKLPLNFHSPYKATSIIDFWRRWHMTLSRFLRDYLYIPLGGNRKGPARRYLNLFVTMLLGGLWHGAAWTFVAWGALHGLYLFINHAWRALLKLLSLESLAGSRSYRLAAGTLTFLAVLAGWVFFRAADSASAVAMLQSMTGVHGFDFRQAFVNELVHRDLAIKWIVAAAVIAWALPNTQQVFSRFAPGLEMVAGGGRLKWQPATGWLLFIILLALTSLYHMNRVSEFLYFQF
jgi:D-alanyl-lipoteichoic acid acyltransferase DltB (MBOAT superfamily)